MATGDVRNNMRKLKNALKAIRFDGADNLDVAGLTEGNAAVYLPIYHHAFTTYSPKVAEYILSRNFELYGKTDTRFMEVIYKILRDVFSYNPPVSKDKFFTKGFVERKLIMCTEIIHMVKTKHAELTPGPSKTAMKTSVRPKSAPENKASSAASSNSKPTNSARLSPRYEKPPRQPMQVVNELVAPPNNPPVRHTASVYAPRNVTRHVAGKSDNLHVELPQQVATTPEFITKRSASTTCENASQLGMKTTLENISQSDNQATVNLSEFGHKQTLVYPPETPTNVFRSDKQSTVEASEFGHKQLHFNPQTPSIKYHHPSMVEIVSLPKRPSGYTPDVSILDIQATNSISMVEEPVQNLDQVKEMCKNVEDLAMNLKLHFDNTVAAITTERTQMDPCLMAFEARIQQQLENLRAQLVLLENRMQVVEAKVDNNRAFLQPCKTVEKAPHTGNQNITIDDRGSSSISQMKFLSDPRVKNLEQTPVDISLNFSPIRRIVNGVAGEMFSANEDTFTTPTGDVDSRRSSTPTHGSSICKTEPSFLGAASRIEQMFQETNKILKEQPELPNLRGDVD